MLFERRNNIHSIKMIADRGTAIHIYDTVPQEMVIRADTVIPTLHSARLYLPQFWFLDDVLVGYDVLALEKDFKGTSAYPQLHIYEVWYDLGDDGHTEYALYGYLHVDGALNKKVTVEEVEEAAYDLEHS